MRSPEYSGGGRRPPEGQHFENEYMHYLKPESFTILPPDAVVHVPSPPRAPEPYKLTPRKRHKNQAFSIIAEPNQTSQPSSRSGSPSGRVSPFRGRGFNPSGSRHASPAPSPPPLDSSADELQPGKSSINRVSQIPILKSTRTRRSSAEDVFSSETSQTEEQSPHRSNLQNVRYSKSMVNIVPRNLSKKPPPSPRRISTLKPSFVRLSPIIGSSPEAGSDHLDSSPSRIPRSRSQPPSNVVSPNVSRVVSPSRTPSRLPSKPVTRSNSRSTSRETSPRRSPSKIPMKNSAYKNIPAKIDTFNRVASNVKPKVPQKPKVYSTRSSIRKTINKIPVGSKTPRREVDDTETTDTDRETVRSNTRSSVSSVSKDSVKNLRSDNYKDKPSTSGHHSKQQNRTRHDSEKGSKQSSNNKSSTDFYEKSSTSNGGTGESSNKKTESKYSGIKSRTNSQTFRREENGAKENKRKNDTTTATSTDELSKTEESDTTEDAKDDDILSVTIDEIIGSQTTKIVSATAETVVKPLNIEAKLIKQSDINQTEVATNEHVNDLESIHQSNDLNPSKSTTNNLTVSANGSVVNTPTSHPLSSAPTPQNNTNQVSPSIDSVNNIEKNVSNSLTPSVNSLERSVNSLERNVKNNFNNLTPPDSDKVRKSLMDSSPLAKSTSQKMKQARTVIVDEIKPIKITVREKSGDVEVQSGNFVMPRSATNGISERPLLPPPNQAQNATNESSPSETPPKPGPCSKIFSCCKKKPKDATAVDGSTVSGVHSLAAVASDSGAEQEKAPKCWDKICCKTKGGKVGDVKKSGCFPTFKRGKNNSNWAERRDSILSEPPKRQPFSMTLRKIFCTPCTKCKKKPEPESVSRRTSMMSKKKSMSSTTQPPPEDTGPKLDPSLVEHGSHMRGAIPILPVPLAWMCLICNVFLPGFGTILSGLLCLCIGKPRFSPRDSAKARVGAFLIDIIVGISQTFTVLFCLVGWGWSIWWGIIMLKIAKKHRKIRAAEKNQIEEPSIPSVNVNHTQRDVERGS